ncbi:sodium/hydrogen exchanger 9B2-like [Hyalella azteca]|uniref:Sodium/hydrogen exchanger 9B2-like n=1 Tax=Hyalella azteca TaxID=294128 RepID=A0A979FHN1_HYAAZ|nr:sodium/hydrogen exchanger 9B2-like [Hyalella azteca]
MSLQEKREKRVCGLPPLLGMLLVGMALRSVAIVGDSVDPNWSSSIRNIALVVILLRSGLGLDPKALKAMSLVVFRLAFVPCLVETTVVAFVSHFLLDFPWLWGFMLGFVLAAVSPAVVVPCLLQLSQQGYGVDKGILTLVIAAASIDDVIAISGFGVMLGMTFSEGKQCMLDVPGFRLNLSVLSMAFIAGVGFRRQGWGDDDNPVGQHCNAAWGYLQPMLFALIGTEIQLDTIGLGVATLCISLTCRVVTTFFVVLGSGLNIRERFFVALAWLQKATVQVLTIAVLVILISVPIGAIAIMTSAPRLLQRPGQLPTADAV